MMARPTALFLLAVGSCWGRAETVVTARLKAELKAAHPYVLPIAGEENPDLSGEPVFKLEPMLVTGSPTFEVDILAEARRAAAAREAMKFSLRKGGTLFSSRRADLGFWPKLVPVTELGAGQVKRGTVGIAVDLLRIKW